MSYAFKLFQLQQIDSHLDQARFRLDEIEKALANDTILNQAKQIHSDKSQALGLKQKNMKNTEDTAISHRLKIEQNESTLYSGKVINPKELQDLQNEVIALKKYLVVLEDRLLDAMMEYEDANHECDDSKLELIKIERESLEKNQILYREKEELLAEVQILSAKREASFLSIPIDDINLYEQLRKQRRGVAVARLADNSCGACGSILNAALLQTAKSPNLISRCNSCGRILYGG